MSNVGRPSLYPDNAHEIVKSYLSACDEQDKLPTIERLAFEFNVHRDTLYAWAEAHADFSDILEAIMQVQADNLIQRGLTGKYNSTITKLMLTKHGYHDKNETDITSGHKPLPILPYVPGNAGNQEDSTAHEAN